MTTEEIETKLKALFGEELGIDTKDLTRDTKIEQLGMDSLDVVEMIMAAEEEFNITPDDAEVEDLEKKTLGDAIRLIQDNIGK